MDATTNQTESGSDATPGAAASSVPPVPASAPPAGPCPLPLDGESDLWVFGYGSLMWNPGFPYEARLPALLHGWHRRFCIYSVHYRGTPERPGLVLGLDRGGSCRGMAFQVAGTRAAAVWAYLWQREMVSSVYRPLAVTLRLAGGECPRACAFVADPRHDQYCGEMEPEAMAALIGRAEGPAGPNRDYLFNTLLHLEQLGINDRQLRRLAERVRARLERDARDAEVAGPQAP